jgi:hypothetical protein
MLACYDQAKESVAALLGDPMTNGPSLPTRLGASATAGFTAALFSLPFDLIKSRLMAQKPDPLTGVYPYKGVSTCRYMIQKRIVSALAESFSYTHSLFFHTLSLFSGLCLPNCHQRRSVRLL